MIDNTQEQSQSPYQSQSQSLTRIIEAALMAASEPLSLDRLLAIFHETEQPTKEELCSILADIAAFYVDRSIELKELASGYCFQVKSDLSPWISRLWEERPTRYSRALLETLAIIAYRQPVTRAEIEDIRGVSVSSTIMKTLLDREWIRVVGQRDVPGKPSIYATTRQFLDHFNLKNLEELPSLSEVMALETLVAGIQPDQETPSEQMPISVSVVSEVPLPIDVMPVKSVMTDAETDESAEEAVPA
jgi:segregation and condensation protein B